MTAVLRTSAVPLAWGSDEQAALAWRHGLALCRALALEGAAVTACVVSEQPLPKPAERALRRLAGRHGIVIETAPEPELSLEGNLYARLAYRFHRWARGRGFGEIQAVDLYGLPYYCLLDRAAGRDFTGTAFGILSAGPSRALLLERGRFPQADTLGRLFLEDECLARADRVRSVAEAALLAIDLDDPESTAESTLRPGAAGLRVLALGEELTEAELRFLAKALRQARPRLPGPVSLTIVDLAAVPSPDVGALFAGSAETVTVRAGESADLPDLFRGSDIAVLPGAVRDAAWLAVLCRAARLRVVGRGHAELAALAPGLAPCGPPLELASRLLEALEAPPPEPLPAVRLELDPPAPPASAPAGKDGPPLVSVCVTHFNRPRLLRQAVASIAAQTHPAFELVVVDDGSDDPEALRFLDELEAEPPVPAFRLIRQANRYLGAARNAAASAAAGAYLLFMDDDNLAKPEELSVLAAAARASGADIVTCFNDTFSRQDDEGRPLPETRRLFFGPAAQVGVLFNGFGDANALIRTEAFHRFGGFSEDYGVGHEDYEFFARAVLAGARLLTVPDALFWYRVDAGSMIKTTTLGLNHARALRPYLAGTPLATDLAMLARGSFIEADRTVAMLQEDGRRKQEAVEVLEAANADKQRALAVLEDANVEKQRAVDALQAVSVEKQQAIDALQAVNAEKQGAIDALQVANTEKQQVIDALQTLGAEKQRVIEEQQRIIEEQGRAIEAIHRSFTWRLGGPVRRSARLARRVVRLLHYRRHDLVLVPAAGISAEVAEEDGLYRSTGEDPQFDVRTIDGRLPGGWTRLSYGGQGIDHPLVPELYVDAGAGASEAGKLALPPLRSGRITQFLRLPLEVRGLRFDPLARPGRFRLERLEATSMGGLALLALLAARHPRRMLAGLAGGRAGLARAVEEVIRLENAMPALGYRDWIACFDSLDDTDRAAIRERASALPIGFTVVIPAGTAAPADLAACVSSVREQLHPRWRLVLVAADAAALPTGMADDPRVTVVAALSDLAPAGGRECGDWIAWVEPGVRLAPHALFMAACRLAVEPDTELLYADEDRLDGRGERMDPVFKPGWSPDFFQAKNYLGPLIVLRRTLLEAGAGLAPSVEDAPYAAALLLLEREGEAPVRHIPFVLSHRTVVEEAAETARRGRERALLARRLAERSGAGEGGSVRVEPWLDGTANHLVYPLPEPAPLVSIIVPTKDKIDLLRLCVESLRDRTAYSGGFEILVIDNRSATEEARAYFTELERTGKARVIPYDAPFNYSAINNFGVRHARGSVLGFLNNDIEVIDPHWLAEMTANALRPEIGAVGALLYYPDDTVQHAGVGLGLHTLVGHLHKGLPRGSRGYAGRAALAQNFSAMTAACLVMRRSVFEEAGGFEEEHLQVAFNDVDLCLRLRASGYRLLWTPHAALYHHEGASRGRTEKPERLAQFAIEVGYMREHWAHVAATDPYYNPNLTLEAEDYGLAWPPRVVPPWRLPPEPPAQGENETGRSDIAEVDAGGG
ncbi:glycosyltransferase [Azospirillum sp. SYSU D00513]|uniref:glycosyltransferase n=2 Tax=Pseudomonadati TaxID=3379134 RepID=UPI001A95CCCA|nr:glycosyltransferase [Azospirillum sp. SYSU D00513]